MLWVNDETGVLVYGDTDEEAERRLTCFLQRHPGERGSWTRVDSIWLVWDGVVGGHAERVRTDRTGPGWFPVKG